VWEYRRGEKKMPRLCECQDLKRGHVLLGLLTPNPLIYIGKCK
jgi:hypothetical protein